MILTDFNLLMVSLLNNSNGILWPVMNPRLSGKISFAFLVEFCFWSRSTKFSSGLSNWCWNSSSSFAWSELTLAGKHEVRWTKHRKVATKWYILIKHTVLKNLFEVSYVNTCDQLMQFGFKTYYKERNVINANSKEGSNILEFPAAPTRKYPNR